MRKEVQFFVVLHSDLALVDWAAVMLFLLAHVWLPLLLMWIVTRRLLEARGSTGLVA
ncbi:MAG TPA: hypothetical protein VFP52_14250 [Myxococcales bacterium]|nr:hypothetical protein [Myxococcales bacterium]